MHILKTLAASLAIALPGVLARGHIRTPEEGTKVAPGSWVPFYYESMGEYSVTSYNFTVWLYTSDPREGLFTGEATGVSVGTWSYSSSTNTQPAHPPPPAQIYIPDFSKGPGGFAGGKNASDAPLWLSVFEEYGTGWVFGSKIAYTSNQLVYNSTQSGETTTASS